MEDNLNQARENIETAFKHVNKLIHPAIWLRLNDLSQEIDNLIEDEAAQPES